MRFLLTEKKKNTEIVHICAYNIGGRVKCKMLNACVKLIGLVGGANSANIKYLLVVLCGALMRI